jgi:DNA-binding CsgD family transcriptional regulator
MFARRNARFNCALPIFLPVLSIGFIRARMCLGFPFILHAASMTDEQLITHKIAEISAFAEQYPGAVIILNGDARRVLYMSARGLLDLNTTQAEVTAMGEEYYARYFNPDEAHEYVPKVVDLLERNDLSYTVTFFQQVRTGPGREFVWHLSTARVLAQSSSGQPLLLICFSTPIDPKSHITAKVQRLLDENTFLRQHSAVFASLTTREREVLGSLALGHTSQEIAAAFHISSQTADTHRRNIRQKLGATSSFDLGQYARAFDLI